MCIRGATVRFDAGRLAFGAWYWRWIPGWVGGWAAMTELHGGDV
mgnify:CR=1 FL=1